MLRRFAQLLPSRSPRVSQRPRRLQLLLEHLETRLAPAIITVTGTGDTIAIDGLATLREAITSINNQMDVNTDVTLHRVGGYATATGGTPDVIDFLIAGTGVQTISPVSALPTITAPLTLDGYTQPLATANTLANGDNAKILIELNGAGAGSGVNGLTITAGSTTIRGLAVNRFSGNGILVTGGGSNTITGNFVGTIPAGTAAVPNGIDGIRVEGSSDNTIGGTTPDTRNLASGNTIDGIHIVGTLATPATNNLIEGNFSGVNAAGTGSVGLRTGAPAPGTAEGNSFFGIEISGGNNNTVGGTTAGARNVVGFNGAGIEVDDGGQGNTIQGNYSGVGADGVTPVGNLLHGIVLRSSNGFGAPLGPAQVNEPGVQNNLIGGTIAGAGNLVEFNGTGGIAVFGNPISASGQANIGNAILGNSVFENGRSNPTFLLGIDLTNQFTFPKDDGITPNDPLDVDAGPSIPNNFQNFPVLTSASPVTGGGTTVSGSLNSTPSTTFRVEFFASNADPMNGVAEGQTFLGFTTVTTNGGGDGTFSVTLPGSAAIGQVVTATATDPGNNTSEFSAPVNVFFGTPQNFVVVNTNDSGTGSLRQAILNSNASPGVLDTISFNIPGGGTQTISPTSALPTITDPVVIDGTTQPGFTNKPVVVVNGASAGANANGFDIELGLGGFSSGVTIKGLVINGFSANGVLIGPDNVSGAGAPTGTAASIITGNYIGTDPSGTTAVPNSLNGVFINGVDSNNTGAQASNNVISDNLISGNRNDGVLIEANVNGIASGNLVSGNFIGTTVAGTAALPNGQIGSTSETGSTGVEIMSASGNLVGGISLSGDSISGAAAAALTATAGAGNVVSGNAVDGIHIIGTVTDPATSNGTAGNFVGVDASGNLPLGNARFGIEVSGAQSTTVGGEANGDRNVVGANAAGIEVDNGGQNNFISGNFSGVGADGTSKVGNKLHGIVLRSNGTANPPLGPGQTNEPGVQNNLVGGTGVGDGNLVEFNGTGGIAVFGNPIALSGQPNIGNTIEGNSVFQNGRSSPSTLLGIDLTNGFPFPKDDGLTPNDSKGHGAANAPNNFQDFPVLTAVTTGSGTTISGTLTQSVSPATDFRIEFFANDPDPQNGIAEGQIFIGFVNVTTNANGTMTFSTTVPFSAKTTQVITATATEIGTGNTSEFSAAVAVTNAVPTITTLSPANAFEGASTSVMLTVNGTNFVSSSVVRLNGTPLATTFVSDTKLQAVLPAGVLGDEASLSITVVNPPPGGGPSNAVAFNVLESLLPDNTRGTPNQRFVSEVYHDLLRRPVDQGGLTFWSGQLDQGISRAQVVLGIEGSREYRMLEVNDLYQKFLHRQADPQGLNSAVALLQQGFTVEQVGALLAGSQEYFFNRGGGTNDGFLDALYADTLHRPIDPQSRAMADFALNSGTSRTQIAQVVLNSNEYHRRLVDSYFQQFLDRNADPGGESALASALDNGARDEQIIAAMIGDTAFNEFFNKTAP